MLRFGPCKANLARVVLFACFLLQGCGGYFLLLNEVGAPFFRFAMLLGDNSAWLHDAVRHYRQPCQDDGKSGW